MFAFINMYSLCFILKIKFMMYSLNIKQFRGTYFHQQKVLTLSRFALYVYGGAHCR